MYAPLDPSPFNRLVHDAAQRARSVAPEVEVTEAVVTGDAVSVLEAESRAADLVVVGSRGMGASSACCWDQRRCPWPPRASVR